jgi:hypothetical protein
MRYRCDLNRTFGGLGVKRRSFLLMAGGAGLLSPRVSGLHQLLDPLESRQSNDRIRGVRCGGGPLRAATVSAPLPRMALPGSDIPKYTEPLQTFDGVRVSAADITVSVEEFQQYVLPACLYTELPSPFDQGTFVWGYRVGKMPPHLSRLYHRGAAGNANKGLLSQ